MSSRPDTLLLAFDDEQRLGRALASALGCGFALVHRHGFPDGETRLRLPPALPPQVLLLRGLQQPNAKLTELMLAASGARELGALRLGLIAPYLAYMRQDMAFVPGEVVSQRHLGRALAAWFDAVLTIDPHLHRVPTLAAVVPGRCGIALSAAPLMGAWIAAQRPGALVLGPDEEAAQWVRAAAEPHGLPHAVCVKQRRGDREVEVVLPAVEVAGRDVVLLDDVASTGRTLVQAARAALAAGARGVDVAVTHALFVGDALEQVRAAGVRAVWSSDCVEHQSNAVSVVPLLAAALAEWLDPHRVAAAAGAAAGH
jgi:ribose-phosphate pyrophosphokinase